MPNRILREGIIESRRVNRLNSDEEVFYRRLMSIVDDYGRWEADPQLLRSRLYPLKLDENSDTKIADMLVSTIRERLVFLYAADGKLFLQLLDFRQQTRSSSKYPEPNAKRLKSFATHMLSDAQREQLIARAKQMIANAHLVVCVSVCEDVCVCGDVFEVVSVVAPPEPGAPPTTDEVPWKEERKPKSVADVIAFGGKNGVTAVEARKFYEYNQARKWRAVRPAGEGWRGLLMLWKKRGQEGYGEEPKAASKNSSDGPPPDWNPETPHAHTGGIPLAN